MANYQQRVLSNLNYSLVKNVDDNVVGGFDSCDNNDNENDDDNDDDDVDAGGYQQHVPSNLNYFDLRLCRDVPLFFEGSRHKGNEN